MPSAQPPSALLRPRLNTSIYDEPQAPPAASLAASADSLMDDMPVIGPSVGPSPLPDGMMVEGYAEAGHDEHGGYDLSEGRVVDISQEEMRKVIGQSKQYDFAPPPQKEVKIAANFWSRTSGAVEAHYQASSLQKRKHQINSLAADAAARSSEIAARGSKGMKSKAETAAKYGW